MRISTLITLALLLSVMSLTAQTVITDDSLTETSDVTWTSDNEYIVDGLTYLETGGKLTIEAGTVVKFRTTPSNTMGGDNTSALIITRGSQIFVNGTREEPVIFTFENDDVTDPNDVDILTRGQWGGLIILGNATVARPGGVDQIEGIPAGAGPRAQYGGGMTPDDDDNSGSITYLSLRHGGKALASGDEINGLTLGGVGRGTTIDFVEVYSNDDDGIEWFGGTVDVKHAVVSFGKDDSFDYDYGWRGRGQYWFSLNSSDISGRGGEHDGASPDDQAPFSNPTIANVTYIGSGVNSNPGEDGNDYAVEMRDNAGGKYYNSVFTDFPGDWLRIEDLASGVDTRERILADDIVFAGNVLGAFNGGSSFTDLVVQSGDGTGNVADLVNKVNTTNAISTMQLVRGISRDTDGGLDPRPDPAGPLRNYDAAVAVGDFSVTTGEPGDFFDEVDYAGAFGGQNWLRGWTALSEYGILNNQTDAGVVEITDATLTETSDVIWTSDNTYIVDGLTFLETGGKLTIEAGTVVKFVTTPASVNDNTSALIVTRGAQIFINGTQTEPVIFTFENDDVSDPDDIDPLTRGQWGGLIILGNATVARPGGIDNIEGIPAGVGIRAQYGGGANPDDMDNSGRINYLSLRHGGKALASGDEINGLTLGGVGAGTIIDFVEVFANDDDGIEWFGGTVSIKHASVAFGKDDSYDYDYGWRGNGQFWFSINSDDISGRGGEHDGASPDDQAPFSRPTISNATYIGSGSNSSPGEDGNDFALVFRDNAGGTYTNSIFTDFPDRALNVEDLPNASGVDSYQRLQAGDLQLTNNIWWDFGAGTDLSSLVRTYDSGDDPDASDLITYLGDNGNQLVDPNLGGISRVDGMGMLDPRPSFGPALNSASTALIAGNTFFDQVNYLGAFSPKTGDNSELTWLNGWTALSEYGYLGNLSSGIEEVVAGSNVQLAPNPANGIAYLTFDAIANATARIDVLDQMGRVVASEAANVGVGQQRVAVRTESLAAGIYTVRLAVGGGSLAKRLVVR